MNIDSLDTWIVEAQEAVKSDEVQQMIRRLADFGLGVCMPHGHAVLGGNDKRSMVELGEGIVQVERGLKVSFVDAAEVDPEVSLPVAWRWSDCHGAVVTAASCHFCGD